MKQPPPNPELTYTLELARTLNRIIDAAADAQQHEPDCAFSQAIRRGREALISMCREACDELAPISGRQLSEQWFEVIDFVTSLQCGAGAMKAHPGPSREVPGSSPGLRSEAQQEAELELVGQPDAAPVKDVMEQWRPKR